MTSVGNRQSTIDNLPTLPHYLRPGLRVVFIGYNPGIESARAGHYYARPGNAFWKQLSECGLVTRTVGPSDDAGLMDEAGIGFTDLCARPTLRAQHLTDGEVREGALRLYAELLENSPAIAVFSGKGIYQLFGRHTLGLARADLARRPYGEQPECIPPSRNRQWAIGNPAMRLWVIPSSSGLASKWHRERAAWMRKLAQALAEQPGPQQA